MTTLVCRVSTQSSNNKQKASEVKTMAKNRKYDPDKYHAAFPSRLRNLIAENNMSENELARQINVSKQSVNYYSTGGSAPDIEKLAKIAQAFNVSTDYLLGLSDLKMTDAMEVAYSYTEEKKHDSVDADKRLINAVKGCSRGMSTDRAKDVFAQILKSESFQEFINILSVVQDQSATLSDMYYDLRNPSESKVFKDVMLADIEKVQKEETEETCRRLQSAIHRTEEIMAGQKLKRYELFDLCNTIIEEIGYYSDARKRTEKELSLARGRLEDLEFILKEE